MSRPGRMADAVDPSPPRQLDRSSDPLRGFDPTRRDNINGVLTARPKPASAPAKRHPLGMPAGSIRAALTLTVVAVVVIQTGRGISPGLLWTETLLVVLAHYFASRRVVEVPPAVMQKLDQEGLIDNEAHPLFLPKHSIRTLILASFAGLAYVLYQEGRFFDREAMSTLGIVFAYLFGVLFRGFSSWWSRLAGWSGPAWWGDVKALAVLCLLGGIAFVHLSQPGQKIEPEIEHLTLGLTLFYFGSR